MSTKDNGSGDLSDDDLDQVIGGVIKRGVLKEEPHWDSDRDPPQVVPPPPLSTPATGKGGRRRD